MSGAPAGPGASRPPRFLAAQNFEGATRIPAEILATATGLKRGDELSPKLLNAVRQMILDMYAGLKPPMIPSIRCQMQMTIEGSVTLNWIIEELQ